MWSLPFTDMWAKAYRKFPHSNQDTNNSFESYHMHLKYRYLYEENNSCHKRVDWLIFVLLKKVELYYIHNQCLKEGVIRPTMCKKQETLSKSRANQIWDEDCLHDPRSINEFIVRSQNKDTPHTWYNVICIGSEFNFCSCDWALNGNVCKHIFKVQMWASEHGLDFNMLPNFSSPITESHIFLVDLNQLDTMSSF